MTLDRADIARTPGRGQGALPVGFGYDLWAATYDTDANATRDLDAAVLRATALPLEGASIVEIGAGTGKNTAYLAERARTVVALDLSEGMLARARARVTAPHVRFVQQDITTRWPVADGIADLVIGNLVLEHIADCGPVMDEARRVLRPGGLAVLCELHPYRQWRGAGAKIAGPDGETPVQTFLHSTTAYVTGALAAGLTLTAMAEIGDEPQDGASSLPRLLQLIFAA